MRARYYEVGSGRFISEDPQFDGRNWFAYADDNPISGVDWSGVGSLHTFAIQMGWLAFGLIGLAVGIALLLPPSGMKLAALIAAVGAACLAVGAGLSVMPSLANSNGAYHLLYSAAGNFMLLTFAGTIQQIASGLNCLSPGSASACAYLAVFAAASEDAMLLGELMGDLMDPSQTGPLN
jgi:hypothetical protein